LRAEKVVLLGKDLRGEDGLWKDLGIEDDVLRDPARE